MNTAEAWKATFESCNRARIECEKECDALRKDAERYRCVQDLVAGMKGEDDRWRFVLLMDPSDYHGQGSITQYFDAAIDDAIEQERKS